jgi:hypothetical protein
MICSKKLPRASLVLMLSAVANLGFGAGRYADPPDGLIEVTKFTEQALEAAKQGNKDAALDSAKQGRKIAYDSFKEKSTMPMQKASTGLKAAISSLDAGNTAEAIPPLEEVKAAMNKEIEYYKGEGKLK